MKRTLFIASLAAISAVGLVAQQNSSVPQPRPDALPAPGTGTPNPGRNVPKPEAVMPTVPAGFTVTSYVELPTPRMMVYAPNGDLFVSSPASNTIVVLRDANNDGTFEACSVFAAGPAPGAGRGGRGAAATPTAVPPGCPAALTNPNMPPAPARGAARAGPPPAAPRRQGGAAPGAAAGGQAPAGAPGGGQRAGGQGFGGGAPGGGRGGPSVLGANAPACTPPPDFV